MRAVGFVELVDLREEEISVLLRGIRVRVKCRYVGVVVSFWSGEVSKRRAIERIDEDVVCLDNYILQS